MTKKNQSTLILPLLSQLPVLTSHLGLNGANGTNRETQRRCQINANNDYEAIQCWLNEYRAKESTFRTYQKEAERFLLWCVYQLQKPLSSIERGDIDNYMTFLSDPQPRETWCAKSHGRNGKRGHANWRPFIGPLSQSAKMTAMSVLDSLFSYLVEACYLSFNPLSLIRRRTSRMHQLHHQVMQLEERILTLDEWHTMLDVLEKFPEATTHEKNEKMRLIFIINILYFLGLRINEVATHEWRAFRQVDDQWWFYVLGKGDKVGRIPVNDALLRAIILYRTHLNKSPYPTPEDTTPLIHSLTTKTAITPRQINHLLKRLAMATAARYADQPEKAKKIRKFSAHWLRHLSASMQDRAGVAFKHIRANHRHENDETTRRYVHALDHDRHVDMQKLTLRMEKLSS